MEFRGETWIALETQDDGADVAVECLPRRAAASSGTRERERKIEGEGYSQESRNPFLLRTIESF